MADLDKWKIYGANWHDYHYMYLECLNNIEAAELAKAKWQEKAADLKNDLQPLIEAEDSINIEHDPETDIPMYEPA